MNKIEGLVTSLFHLIMIKNNKGATGEPQFTSIMSSRWFRINIKIINSINNRTCHNRDVAMPSLDDSVSDHSNEFVVAI